MKKMAMAFALLGFASLAGAAYCDDDVKKNTDQTDTCNGDEKGDPDKVDLDK